MRRVLIHAAIVAALPMVGAACGAKLPASPVPAPLTLLEAGTLAETRLEERLDGTMLTSVHPTGKGYLLGYMTYFDPDLVPPSVAYLVEVEHDGTVREYDFGRDR